MNLCLYEFRVKFCNVINVFHLRQFLHKLEGVREGARGTIEKFVAEF